jgi:hypothetical protein
MENKASPKNHLYLVIIVMALIILTFATQYYGSTDIGDYTDSAKYFAGKYSAKIRSTHSYMYGFLLSPFVNITESFFIFKAVNIISFLLIAYTIYHLTGKDVKSFYLILLSPIAWYMAPWASPIILSSLFFLWAFYFIEKYDKKKEISSLVYSSISIGIGLIFWDTILYLGVFLGAVYLYNKKFYHSGIFLVGVLIGLSPRLIFDQIYLGFLFYTTVKTFFAGLTHWLFGGIYQLESGYTRSPFIFLLMFLATPLYFWKLYNNLEKTRKQ